MSIYQWLCILGLPTLTATMLGVLVNQYKQIKAVRLGIQGLLRDRLLQAYRHYEEKGWADYEDRANVENLYLQYECLGENGVMEEFHNRFIELPHRPAHREENEND